jgi:hypothetical protein
MKKLILLLLISFFASERAFSQSTLTLTILDEDSQMPVANAGVLIENTLHKQIQFSDSNGIVIFRDLITDEFYDIKIIHIEYYEYYDDFLVDEIELKEEILLSNLYSENKIEDLAATDIFDMSIFSFGISPADNNFKYSYPMSFYAFENRFKLNRFMQFGMRTSLIEFNWLRIADDIDVLATSGIKERYFIFSASYFIYHRFILSKTKDLGNRGLFFDYGVGYRIPYYAAYSNFTSKKSRFTERGIYNLKDFEMMVRIGYSNFSIFGTYRLTNIAKSKFIEPPKLNIGVEVLIGATN